MTDEELENLLRDCPVLYHMAEHGSWHSIRDHGLLGTTALLDLYEIRDEERGKIEAQRRPVAVHLIHPKLPRAVIRDQIPLNDAQLMRCLLPPMLPADWYRLLNGRVFFWLTRERLSIFLNAKAYRNSSHDVIEIDARALVTAHRDRIWLCPINSGATKWAVHPRGYNTFSRIADYAYKRKKRRADRVVELAVDCKVSRIEEFVLRVVEMHGDRELRTVYRAPDR